MAGRLTRTRALLLHRGKLPAAALAVGLLALPATALGSEAGVIGGVLTYQAATDETNTAEITNMGGGVYQIKDLGAIPNIQPRTGENCQPIGLAGSKTVECTGVTSAIQVFLGNQNDSLQFMNVTTLPVTVQAGDGDDNTDGGRVGVHGSEGNDNISGGNGNDSLFGAGGNDVLNGNAGNDDLHGENGNDRFDMNSSPDGADSLSGGSGVDEANYSLRSSFVDPLMLDAYDGTNTTDGAAGEGDDIDSDVESLSGGNSDDYLIPAPVATGGVIDGNAGSDIVDFSDRTNSPVTVTLDGNFNDGAFDTVGGGPVTPENANVTADNEDVTGTNITQAAGSDDYLEGDGDANVLSGLDGNDTLVGNGGNDTLIGGEGNDVQNGGDGDDSCDMGNNTNTTGFSPADAVGTQINEQKNDSDTCTGGTGFDSVSYAGRTAVVRIDQTNGAADDGEFDEGDNVAADVESLTGGSNNDTINGSAIANTIVGNAGNDVINSGDGNDTIFGNDGTDTISSDGGADTISGGNDADTISSGDGNDVADGDGGSDTVDGDAGDDVVGGGLGTDLVRGGTGNDVVREGAGGPNGQDILEGGSGVDVIDYSARTGNINLNVADALFNDGDGEGDRVAGDFETLLTGSGNDNIVGDDDAETIVPGAGSDNVNGGGGNDLILAGDAFAFTSGSADHYDGGAGTDTVSYGPQTIGYGPITQFFGGRFDDLTLSLNDGPNDGGNLADSQEGDNLLVENVTGGSGDDSITGDGGPNVLDGGAGNDTMSGGGGADTMIGGSGSDLLDGEAGVDSYDAGLGADDVRSLDASAETISCGAGSDDWVGDTSDQNPSGDCERRDGPAGASGPTGPGGATGPSGSNGATGPTGASGSNGAAGPTGASGSNGAAGPTGPSGSNGTNGTNGQNGAPGSPGATGPAGANGAPGAPGAAGSRGATGPQGPAGSRVVPVAVTTKLSKSSDRSGAVTFTVTGRIDPGAVNPVACAGGHMSLSVKRGSKTLLTGLRTIGSTCTFRKSFKTSRRSVGRATRLAITGRFLGSEALGPRSASSKSIRVR